MGLEVSPSAAGARGDWRRLSIAAPGVLCAIVGTATLSRWVLHFDNAWAQAMPNAAMGLMLNGVALIAIALRRGKIARAGAVWSLALGIGTLLEYLFAVDLRIDQALIRDLGEGPFPGRIGPNVALCFVLSGVVLSWASTRRNRWRWIGAMAMLSAVIMATGIASVAGYMTGQPSYAAWSRMMPRIGALDSALGFALLGLGLLLVVWWREREQKEGFSGLLLCGVAAGGFIVALCFGQALSSVNVDRRSEIARETGWDPEQVAAVLRLAQGNLPFMLAGIGILVTLLLVLMANETMTSHRRALAAQIASAKLAEETAERQRAQASLDRFVTLGVDLLCILGYDGCFKRINPAWEHLLGYATEELMARPSIEFVHPDDRAATLAAEQKTTEGQTVIEFENRYVCKDGSTRWLLWNSVGNNRTREVYAVARDNTARKKAQDELLELQAQLEQRVKERTAELTAVNKELEAFTSSVSHDLRAPLRRIDGFAQILADKLGGETETDIAHALRRISDGTREMSQLIDDLLSLSRITRQELRTRATDPRRIVEEVVSELASETSGRNVEWRLGSFPALECDPALLKQVFSNLLSNSIKFTRPRHDAVIEIGCNEIDGEYVIFVRDNGVGFDMKHVDKLFGVFQRLHSYKEFPGTGVGLATVRRIVLKHGGRIWAESELNRGAVFYFTLSKHQAEPDPKALAAAKV